jgi:putative peptidoglycan lipid II flippase
MDAEPPKRRSITRTALLLLPVQVVFRGGEALMPLLLSAWFGATAETDVYYLAAAIITFAGTLAASAFQDSALVPTLTEVELRDPKSLPVIAGSLLGHTLLYGAGLALLTGLVALGFLRAGFEGDLFVVGAELMAPFVVYMLALAVRSFFVGLLNMHGRFFAHPIASGAGVVVTIALVATTKDVLGVVALPLAQLAGEIVAISVLAWITRRVAKLRLVLSLVRPEPVRRFARLVASEVLGSAITRINPIVDQAMAALATLAGGATLLRYATDVASLPTSLLQATIITVLLSQLSRDAASRSLADFERTVRNVLLGACAVLAAISFVLYLARAPILRLLFLRGEMDDARVAEMEAILPLALVGVAPFGALLILAKAHIALQNSRIMIWMGVLNAGLNAGFNVLFLKLFGLPGIALSTSMMHTAIAIVFWVLLKRRLAMGGGVELRKS